jgi:hypothetical protein
MDLPFAATMVDIIVREEIGGAVRAVEHPHRPVGRQIGKRDRGQRASVVFSAEVQRVARQQPARGMAAELAELEGAAAAEIGRDVEPAREQDITAHAAARGAAERERLAGATSIAMPRGTGTPSSVAPKSAPVRQIRAGAVKDSVGPVIGDSPGPPSPRDCRAAGCRAERTGRPSDPTAERRPPIAFCRPGQSCTVVAVPPLITRMLRGEGDVVEHAGRHLAGDKGGRADHLAQPAQIRLDAVEAALRRAPPAWL